MFKKNASLASTSTDRASSSSQPFVDETIKNLCETFMAVLEEAAKVGAVTPAVLTELADARSKGYDAWSEKLAEKFEIIKNFRKPPRVISFWHSPTTGQLEQQPTPEKPGYTLATEYFNHVVSINENEEYYNALLLNPLFKQSLDVGLSYSKEEDYRTHPNYYLSRINELHQSIESDHQELSGYDELALIRKASRVEGLRFSEKSALLRQCAELCFYILNGSTPPSPPSIQATMEEISKGIIENEKELNLVKSSYVLMHPYTHMAEPENPPSLVMLMLNLIVEHTQLLENRAVQTLPTPTVPQSLVGLIEHINSRFPSATDWPSSTSNMRIGL